MADNDSQFNPASQCLLHHVIDSAANDSDKSFTVPLGKTWELDWLHIILATTATVGNRQIKLVILDDDSVERMDVHAGTTQAASLTRHYLCGKGVYRETSFVNDEMHVPIPHSIVLQPGWSIRVYDSAAIAAAADDLTVSLQVKQRDV